jgi:hypothetical protein
MTIDNWLMIVLIISTFIATLIAPILQLFVKSRINQPKPTPEPSQPKNRIHRIGGWLMRFFTSRLKLVEIVGLASPFFAMLYPIYYLRKYLLDPAPITRSRVFIISWCVTIIWISFLNFILNFGLKYVWQAITKQAEQFERLVDVVGVLKDRVNTLADTQSAMSKTLELAQLSQTETDTPGILRKMLTTIKNLFGG